MYKKDNTHYDFVIYQPNYVHNHPNLDQKLN